MAAEHITVRAGLAAALLVLSVNHNSAPMFKAVQMPWPVESPRQNCDTQTAIADTCPCCHETSYYPAITWGFHNEVPQKDIHVPQEVIGNGMSYHAAGTCE